MGTPLAQNLNFFFLLLLFFFFFFFFSADSSLIFQRIARKLTKREREREREKGKDKGKTVRHGAMAHCQHDPSSRNPQKMDLVPLSECRVLMVVDRPPPPPKKKSNNNNKHKRLPSLIESKCAVAPFVFQLGRQIRDDAAPLHLLEGGVFGKQVKGQIG